MVAQEKILKKHMKKGGKAVDIEDEPDLMDLLTNERVNVR